MARIPLGIESGAPKDYPQKLDKQSLKLLELARGDRNVDDSFLSSVSVSGLLVPVDPGDALGATSEEARRVIMGRHTHFLLYPSKISVQTGVNFPYVSADGLELATSGANENMGWEIVPDGVHTTSASCHTVGSFLGGQPIFVEATIKIDDISDVTEMALGWRKAEPFQIAVDNYDEMAAINIGADSDGKVEIHTILNNAATSENNTSVTAWADGGEHTLRVEVANDGRCTFLFDDVMLPLTTNFTFDAGENIVPFLFLICETGDPGVSISRWKSGII